MWALTAQAADGSWRREILPLCPQCKRLIEEGGSEGRKFKGDGRTLVRWSHRRTASERPGPVEKRLTQLRREINRTVHSANEGTDSSQLSSEPEGGTAGTFLSSVSR